MNIYLVRHGEASASWGESPDPGLSALGLQQAADSAALLRSSVSQDTLVISSPLLRARQTAMPLASQLGIEVQVVDAFREIPAPVPLAQRQLWLRGFMQQEWGRQEEALKAWRHSAIEHLLSVRGDVVVFTHFLVINAVIGHVLDTEATLCFWPANGSVTRLRLVSSGLELIELGEQLDSIVN
jgi:broad specificity phosphatase PhoE